MNELEWLNEQRPETPEPDTAAARAALVTHMRAATASGEAAPREFATAGEAAPREFAAAGEAAPREFATAGEAGSREFGGPRREAADARRAARADAAPRRSRASSRRRAAWRPRLAFVGVAALVAAAMAVAWPAGEDGSRLPATPLAPEEAVAAPLVRLSQKIAAEPEPKGDATLIHRSHHFPDAKDFTGNDLYLDDGRYYYGMTKAELKASALQSDVNDKLLAAAAAGDRKRVIAATWGDDGPPTEAELKAAAPAMAAERKKIIEAKGGNPDTPPASLQTQDNNRAWMGSMDALLAGAGRSDVRAGVMKILSEMPKVKVTETAETLTLTQTDFPDGYEETLIVDAKTGVPMKFIGGDHGKRPDVVVDYEIKRVTAANWADAAA